MKKVIYLFFIITASIVASFLAGCSKKTQMADFIPTEMQGEGSEDEKSEDKNNTDAIDTPEPSDGEASVTQVPKEIYAGQTTPMYVKLSEYDDTLNVREEPTTNSKIVGFLVHTEKINVIEITDGWASFIYKEQICYVNADYLVSEKPAYLDPPTPTPAAQKENITRKTDDSGPEI